LAIFNDFFLAVQILCSLVSLQLLQEQNLGFFWFCEL